MPDRFDDLAKAIEDGDWRAAYLVRIASIAAALRRAYNDGVEAGARLVEEYDEHAHPCPDLPEELRALKAKEPTP